MPMTLFMRKGKGKPSRKRPTAKRMSECNIIIKK